MPKRSNLFQEVVAIIHEHMAEGATVEESVEFTHRATGDPREVDVVVRTTVGGHEVVVGVEAQARSRPADVGWVEQMIQKHAGLPTDKLVLVAEKGFSKQARKVAEAAGVVAIAPDELTDADPAFVIVNRLRSIWPKTLSFTPERGRIFVLRPGVDGTPERKWFRAHADHLIFLDDGTEIGQAIEVTKALMNANMEKVFEQIDLANIAESMESKFTFGVGPPWKVEVDGVERGLTVRWEEDGVVEFHEIDGIEVIGDAKIEVVELSLTHRRLGDVSYAYGEAIINEEPALVLITENECGGKLTFRRTIV